MNLMFKVGYMLLTLAIASVTWYFYFFIKKNQVKETDIDEKQEKEVNEKFKKKGVVIEPLKPEVKNIKEMIKPIKEKPIKETSNFLKRKKSPLPEPPNPPVSLIQKVKKKPFKFKRELSEPPKPPKEIVELFKKPINKKPIKKDKKEMKVLKKAKKFFERGATKEEIEKALMKKYKKEFVEKIIKEVSKWNMKSISQPESKK